MIEVKLLSKFLIKEIAVIAILGLIVVYHFYGVLTGELTLILPPDSSDMVYPNYHYIASTLKSGILPLWDPHLFSGYSMVGYPQYGLFYPLNLLFWLWPYGENPFPVYAYEYSLVLHVFLAGWFMYLLGRVLKFNRLVGLVMGVAFMLSGNFLLFLYWGNSFPAFAWFPLVMLFAVLTFGEKYRNNSFPFFGGLALGMLILAAPAQPMIQILMIIGLFYLFCLYEQWQKKDIKRLKKISYNFLIMTGIGISMGMVSILPALEVMPHTIRFLGPDGVLKGHEKMSFEAFTHYKMNFKQILGFFMPQYGRGVVSNSFVGLVPLVLSLVAVFGLFRKNLHVRFFTCLSILSLIYALGILLPMIAYRIPVLSMIREPERYAFFISFAIPILAGFGLDYLIRKSKSLKADNEK